MARGVVLGMRRRSRTPRRRRPGFAPGGDHAGRRGAVGDLTAVITADDVQAQVDARAASGRGEQFAVVDEEHVRIEAYAREQTAEGVDVSPVSGGAPAIEQP